MAEQRPWYMGPNGGATAFTRGEAQQFARGIVQSDEYRASLRSRAKTGTLPPQVETMLWHYAYGKPVEQVNVTSTTGLDLSAMGPQELADLAKGLGDAMREAKDIEDLLQATAPSSSSQTTPLPVGGNVGGGVQQTPPPPATPANSSTTTTSRIH